MEPRPFIGLLILDMINRLIFGHGVVIYYLWNKPMVCFINFIWNDLLCKILCVLMNNNYIVFILAGRRWRDLMFHPVSWQPGMMFSCFTLSPDNQVWCSHVSPCLPTTRYDVLMFHPVSWQSGMMFSCLYPPQAMFVGGYTVFTLSVRPWRIGFSLISWKGNDGKSSNFADTLISIRCTFIIEN